MKRKKLLSSGRIKADQSKLVPTNSWGVPQYYEDRQFKCHGCGNKFVFTKEEQRAWYEEFGIPHYASRYRCAACAIDFRSHKKLKDDYDRVHAQHKSNPENSVILAELGKLAFLNWEAAQAGNYVPGARRLVGLENAISTLMRAIKRDPRSIESYYWAGRCYEVLERIPQATSSLETFIQKAKTRKGIAKNLLKDAEKRIVNLSI